MTKVPNYQMHRYEKPKYKDISKEYIFSYEEHNGKRLIFNTELELIRCKNCNRWIPEDDREVSMLGICSKWKEESKRNDFCSYSM